MNNLQKASVNYYLSQGAPREKLVLGMPLYGRSFTLANVQNTGVGAPFVSMGNAGPYSAAEGSLGYNEICEMFKQGQWDIHNDAETPYAVKGNQWVGFDDAK